MARARHQSQRVLRTRRDNCETSASDYKILKETKFYGWESSTEDQ